MANAALGDESTTFQSQALATELHAYQVERHPDSPLPGPPCQSQRPIRAFPTAGMAAGRGRENGVGEGRKGE